MTDVTAEGKKLIQNWLDAKERLERLKRELNSVECVVANNHDALAKWLMPDDAKPGEKIAVWHGDSLIQVEVAGGFNGLHVVTVRARGKRGVDGHGRG